MKYCAHCGKEIDDNAVVCPQCGVVTDKEKLQPKSQTNTLSIVGFIFSFLIALVGLICSILGYRKAPELNGSGKGLALAGIIISICNMVLGVILVSLA